MVGNLEIDSFNFIDMQLKLEQERGLRQKADARILEVEKRNSEMTFDLTQLQQRIAQLQDELRQENEKVKRVFGILYGFKFLLNH